MMHHHKYIQSQNIRHQNMELSILILYVNTKKQKSKWGHGCEIKKIPALALCGLSSNGHNFFVSNPNRTLFEALDS